MNFSKKYVKFFSSGYYFPSYISPLTHFYPLFLFFIFLIFFSSFCCIQYVLLNVLFSLLSFLNSLAQQVNVTEVEVFVEIEQ